MLDLTMLDIIIGISIIIGTGLLGAGITFVLKRFSWLRSAILQSEAFETILLAVIRSLLMRTKLIDDTHIDTIVDVIDLTIDFVFDYVDDGQLDKQEIAKFISSTMSELGVIDIPNRDAIVNFISDIIEDVYKFII